MKIVSIILVALTLANASAFTGTKVAFSPRGGAVAGGGSSSQTALSAMERTYIVRILRSTR